MYRVSFVCAMEQLFKTRQPRVRTSYVGASVHQETIEEWCKKRNNFDVNALLSSNPQLGMQKWTRSMPSATAMVEFSDLMKLYLVVDPAISFSQLEIQNGLLNLHAKTRCLCPSLGSTTTAARTVSGVLQTGFSIYRDLRYAAKMTIVLKAASSTEKFVQK